MCPGRQSRGICGAIGAGPLWVLSALMVGPPTEADMQHAELTADGATQIVLDGERHTLVPPNWECAIRLVKVQDGLGKAKELQATYTRQGVQVEVEARLVPLSLREGPSAPESRGRRRSQAPRAASRHSRHAHAHNCLGSDR